MKPQAWQASLSRSSPTIGPNFRAVPQREQKRTFGSSQSGMPPGPSLISLMRRFSTSLMSLTWLLRVGKACVGLVFLYGPRLGVAEGLEADTQRGIGESENLGRKQGRVFGATDGNRGHRDALRHLDDREERVEAAVHLCGDRHADDRQDRLGRDHARQMGRAAGTGDEDADPAFLGAGYEAQQQVRRPMGRDGTQFARNLKAAEHLDSLLHDWEVGATTAHDPDSRNLRLCGHADSSSGELCRPIMATMRVERTSARTYRLGGSWPTRGRRAASISASPGPQSTFATSHDSR